MDDQIKKIVAEAIKNELGTIVSDELKVRFEPIQKQMTTWQTGQDGIVTQLQEDRKEINQNTIDLGTVKKSIAVVIDNQNHQEEKMVEAVGTEVRKIPGIVRRAVERMFEEKPFLIKLKEKFLGKEG